MTKTVKKRLQAVVALLVALMIMVGIMPYQPFNTTVYADTYRIWFNPYKETTWSTGLNGGTLNSIQVKYSGSWQDMARDSGSLYKYQTTSASSSDLQFKLYYSNGTYTSTTEPFVNGYLYYINDNTPGHSQPHITKTWKETIDNGPTITNETVYFDSLNNSKFHDEVAGSKTAKTTWLSTVDATSSQIDLSPRKMYVVTYNSSDAETSVIPMTYDTTTKLWSASVPSHTGSGSSAVEVSYIRFINEASTSTARTNALTGGSASTLWEYANFSTPISRSQISSSSTSNPYIVKGTLKSNDTYLSGQQGLRSVDLKGVSNRSILQGVTYYNYFYDEQIAYEMLGGTQDPSDLKVKTAQYKNPYSLFNQAIMLSNYHYATSHPMYLGEFWLGGNVNENTFGTGYKSNPLIVSSGKKDRSDGLAGSSVSYDWSSNHTYYTYENGIYTAKTEAGISGSKNVGVKNLSKFVWGSNLAFRGTNSAQEFYHIIGSGLVDSTISTSVSSDTYLTPTKNGVALPYFDEAFLSGESSAYQPNTSSSLTSLTSNKPVGKVYNSIFPLYTRTVTFLHNGSSLDGTNPDDWVNTTESTSDWGSLLTVNGDSKTLTNMYTFDSHVDSVRVNTHGGASENTNGGSSPAGMSTTLSGLGLTEAQIRALELKYLSDYSGVITGSTTVEDIYDIVVAGKDNNAVTPSENLTTAEQAVLTAGGFYYDATGKVKDTDGIPGFFPFNKSGISTSELQYGFGLRLDIKFNVGTNGKTDNNDPMIFRFTGDDDVWVFIDGKLVLDMGGGHKNAIGEINFQDGTAATSYKANSNSSNIWNSNAVDTQINYVGSDIGAIINACKDDKDHELTMFYMERGKLNSNMSLMFNFIAPEITKVDEIPETPEEIRALPTPSGGSSSDKTTDSSFKIIEITDFSNVNTGLWNLTKKAAENDVFNYTVQSNVQRNFTTMTMGGFAFATGPTGISRNTGITGVPTTTLTPTSPGTQSGVLGNMNSVIYLDTSDNNTIDTARYIAVRTKNASNEDVTYLGRQVGPHLYAFPYWSSSAQFIYSNDSASGITDGSTTAPSSITNIGNSFTPGDGNIYTVNSSGGLSNTTGIASEFVRNDYSDSDTNWKAVAGINYIWKEAYADEAVSSPSTNGQKLYLTNTTTNAGKFNLLYGLDDDESSAQFINQFYDSANKDGQIRVNIAQRMVRRENSGAVNSWSSDWYEADGQSAARNMGKYYNTKAKIVRENDDGTYDRTSVEWNKNTIVAGVNGVVEVNGIAVDSQNIEVAITNIITAGTVTVSKAIEWNGTESTNDDTFYFKVVITDVFGNADCDAGVADYSGTTYEVTNEQGGEVAGYNNLRTGVPNDGDLATAVGDHGLIMIKAGQKARIQGIPEGTKFTVTELHLSSQKTTNAAWNAQYNKGITKNAPTITVTGLQPQPVSVVNNEVGLEMSGSIYASAARSLNVGFTNSQDSFEFHQIDLVLQKKWKDLPSEATKPTITYLLERTTVDPSRTDANWEPVTSSGNTDGKYTIPAGATNIDSLTLNDSNIVDNASANTPYYYRIREYGENGTSLILTSGGWYNQNYQAVYETTANNVTTTNNIGKAVYIEGSSTVTENESGKTYPSMTRSGTDPNYAYTLTLSIQNEYHAAEQGTGQPLPKTGARGVYAIVTFGAFAITIAGVALLIYRKKLQTVNIYAVKGSGKPKE